MSEMSRDAPTASARDLQEAACTFAGSRGILRSCDLHAEKPISSSFDIPDEIVSRLPEHRGSLHLSTTMLPQFVEKHLDRLAHPFTLVTGDSDRPLGTETFPRDMLMRVLENPLLVRWFAQNLTFTHPKLHHLPLGLDYHTISSLGEIDDSRLPWKVHRNPIKRFFKPPRKWGDRMPPLEQESILRRTAKRHAGYARKRPQGYCNWRFSLDRGDRRECFDRCHPDAMHVQRKFRSRARTWDLSARHAFTLSPFGVGYDCHRTWEALMLGSVPIIHTSPLDPLFDDLPVLIVEDWSEVTPERLKAEQERFAAEVFDYSKLRLDHWKALIDGKPLPQARKMTIDEFTAGL
jgi:hypothetical protein